MKSAVELSLNKVVIEDHESLLDKMWYYDFLLSPKSKNKEVHGMRDMMSSSSGSSSSLEGKKELGFVVESIFKAMDEDGDGKVSALEILHFVERVGMWMPLVEVESIVKGMSESCDVCLTLHEFADFYTELFAEASTTTTEFPCDEDGIIVEEEVIFEGQDDNVDDEYGEVREAFRVFDKNGDGVISAMELGQVLCRLGFYDQGRDERQCRLMIERADLNGDGLIDIHEFKRLLYAQ